MTATAGGKGPPRVIVVWGASPKCAIVGCIPLRKNDSSSIGGFPLVMGRPPAGWFKFRGQSIYKLMKNVGYPHLFRNLHRYSRATCQEL